MYDLSLLVTYKLHKNNCFLKFESSISLRFYITNIHFPCSNSLTVQIRRKILNIEASIRIFNAIQNEN